MSNWSSEGIRQACASPDAKVRESGIRALSEWLKSTDPEKQAAAARISADALDQSVQQQSQRQNEARKAEIYKQFFAAFHEIPNTIANRNILEQYIVQTFQGIITLDNLVAAQEALGNSLSRVVIQPVLSAQDRLEIKQRAIRDRNAWLQTQSKESLQQIAKQEAEAKRRGIDLYADMRLTEEEQEMAKQQTKSVSTSTARVWVEGSSPRREWTRQELLRADAKTLRKIMTDGGGRFSQDRVNRINEILSGATPEGVQIGE